MWFTVALLAGLLFFTVWAIRLQMRIEMRPRCGDCRTPLNDQTPTCPACGGRRA
jgi:hypothetical protein